MKGLASDRILWVLCLCFPMFFLGEAMLHGLPTQTFAGLRAAQEDIGIIPTSPPQRQEILKRFGGDPAICGWVEGSAENVVSCNSGHTCAGTSTFVGCCSTGNLGCQVLFTTCYDRIGPSCDARCTLNKAALICDGQLPYCATYQYAQGSQGYGCAATVGYSKEVLTATNPAPTPFGHSASATSPSSSSSSISTTSETNAQQVTVTAAAATPSPSSSGSISGGAIAGIVVGSVLAVAAIVGITVFTLRRQRQKKEQNRQATTHMSVYDMYAKPPPSTLSPPMSPPMHSRHPSEQTYGYQTSPPLSDNGRPWSPETVNPGVAELAVGEDATNWQKH